MQPVSHGFARFVGSIWPWHGNTYQVGIWHVAESHFKRARGCLTNLQGRPGLLSIEMFDSGTARLGSESGSASAYADQQIVRPGMAALRIEESGLLEECFIVRGGHHDSDLQHPGQG